VVELPAPLVHENKLFPLGCGTLCVLLQGVQVDLRFDVLAQDERLERGILLWLQI
jgi:hypothetical protein